MNALTSQSDFLAETAAVRIAMAAPRSRFSLRLRENLAPFEAALGLSLGGPLGSRASAGERETLRLGPDEWMLHTSLADAGAVEAALSALYATQPHSLVNVSAREVSFVIDGPRAAELLTLGCPRDIAKIAPGSGRRTVFDGVTVILWRDAPDAFRIDCWNSFAPHILDLLKTGARELAAEAP
ncbi:sarcosine oxidase subunit gamma [Citreicella sp. C3M06]|uniref:sarcosine oxidase subunit gamma n=1 Tax=Citreicella sp. C3M06 TaxID=2841564 RepID=UPI001C08568E|nr:sarcosine oxidase subunit gamma [Citreicella sp. C3M06]MBU2959479.1 sarcosine oxidase subunit gamma [Citreicella sp. C3M06]